VARGKTTSWGQSVPYLIQTHRVVPGDPDKSSLYTYAKRGHFKPSADEMTALHDWIQQGAIDPKAPTSKPASSPASKPAGG
jgi:hypothetical protein